MEALTVSLSIVSVFGLFVVALLLRNYLPSYAVEKGKNLASKEDLAYLTELVEGVKALHIAEIERVKATLLSEGQVVERRRRVYEEMCGALRVFQEGHIGTLDAQERFHAAHAAAWLWASDAVLAALNHCIAVQVQHAAQPSAIAQPAMKGAYAAVLLAPRKDTGFVGTTITAADYHFVQF